MVDATDKSDREIALEERRLKLDESFPKKWGSVIFGSFATIIVAAISAAISIAEFEETKRASEAQQRNLNNINSRMAVEMYISNAEKFSPENENSIHYLALIVNVLDNDTMREIFFERKEQIIRTRRANDPTKSVSDASIGLPSIVSRDDFDYSNFTVYIHHPAVDRCLPYAESVKQNLIRLGIRVPPMEAIRVGFNPNQNEIRFYSTSQRDQLASIQDKLEADIGISFITKVLPEPLPRGIFEIWVGQNTCLEL